MLNFKYRIYYFHIDFNYYRIIQLILNLKVNAKILAWLLREAFNISLNIVISYTVNAFKYRIYSFHIIYFNYYRLYIQLMLIKYRIYYCNIIYFTIVTDEDNDDVIESFSLYYIFSVFPSFVYYYIAILIISICNVFCSQHVLMMTNVNLLKARLFYLNKPCL